MLSFGQELAACRARKWAGWFQWIRPAHSLRPRPLALPSRAVSSSALPHALPCLVDVAGLCRCAFRCRWPAWCSLILPFLTSSLPPGLSCLLIPGASCSQPFSPPVIALPWFCVVAVCLPVWPLLPAPVPGWALLLHFRAVPCLAVLSFVFCFAFFLAVGCLQCVLDGRVHACRVCVSACLARRCLSLLPCAQLFVLGSVPPGALHFPCPFLRPIGQPVRCCAACTPPPLTQLRCILAVSW